MKQIIFLVLSVSIYVGSYTIVKKIFDSEDIASNFGIILGSICFYWMISNFKDE
jgi:hypothetical protein